MSVNDSVHDDSNYWKQSSKKYVFKREQKTGSDGADVICCVRLFQIRTATTGNARSPYVQTWVQETDSLRDKAPLNEAQWHPSTNQPLRQHNKGLCRAKIHS